MLHLRRRSRAAGAARPHVDAAAAVRIPRPSTLGACLTCSLLAFAGGWLAGTSRDGAPSAPEAIVPSGTVLGVASPAAPAAATTAVLEVQAGPSDPRELVPLPGPGPDDGVVVPEECLPMEGDGDPMPMPGPGDTGPGGGPQELIPLEPVPRQGPGGPAPAPGGPSPAPRDPPGTLRAHDLTPRQHETAPLGGGTA